MMTRSWAAALLLVSAVLPLAACGAPVAPSPAQRASIVTPLTLEPPPIYSLLGYRSDLSLTSEQVTRLDSLALWVRDANAPLKDSLYTLGGDNARLGGAFEVGDVGKPVLAELRENNRHAAETVGQILDENQRVTLCGLYDRTRRRSGAGQQQRQETTQRGRSAEADTANSFRGGRVWPWCRTGAAAADSTAA